jgi:hypothetical protein
MSDFMNDTVKLEIIKSNKKFKCSMCAKNFVYKDVIGQLQCWYHRRDFDNYLGKYICCGQKENMRGCCRTDHTTNPYCGDSHVAVPLYMYEQNIYKNPKFVEMEEVETRLIKNEYFYIIRVKEFC